MSDHHDPRDHLIHHRDVFADRGIRHALPPAAGSRPLGMEPPVTGVGLSPGHRRIRRAVGRLMRRWATRRWDDRNPGIPTWWNRR